MKMLYHKGTNPHRFYSYFNGEKPVDATYANAAKLEPAMAAMVLSQLQALGFRDYENVDQGQYAPKGRERGKVAR